MTVRNKPAAVVASVVAFAFLLTGCVQGNPEESVAPSPVPSVSTTESADPTTSPAPTTGSATPPGPVPTVDGGYVAPTQEPAPALAPALAPAPAPAPADSNATALLALLVVADEQNGSAYNRDLFPHWSTQGDGCSTRETVLADEATTIVNVRNCVTTGTWVSAYDGQTLTNPSDLDVDHMVPLKEAWLSGASAWDTATREAFANDIFFDPSLIAVSASSNRSKSDRDPAEWMPSSMDACQYGIQWMQVKIRWSLSIDVAEQQALSRLSSGCGNTPAPVPPIASVTKDSNPQAAPAPAPVANPGTGADDPKFSSCKDAKAAGFGPYVSGQDPEYAWYRDGDSDGTVCE